MFPNHINVVISPDNIQIVNGNSLCEAYMTMLVPMDCKFCVRHLYNNFRKNFLDLKQMIWNTTKATYSLIIWILFSEKITLIQFGITMQIEQKKEED